MRGLPLLDLLMANAWPSAVVEHRQGWRFRWADGMTRRANSALAAGGDENVAELVADVEGFYRSFGVPPLIQVSSASAPPSLVPFLEARGYRPTARTLIARAEARDVAGRARLGSYEVKVTDGATDDWFETYWSVESRRERDADDAALCRGVLLAPPQPSVFVAVHDQSEVISVGQVVIERGWAGVQCMVTRPAHRRRGAASAVLHALATEAVHHNAEHMYLAVMADNAAGLGLYEGVGFDRVHEYSYWAGPAEQPSTR